MDMLLGVVKVGDVSGVLLLILVLFVGMIFGWVDRMFLKSCDVLIFLLVLLLEKVILVLLLVVS